MVKKLQLVVTATVLMKVALTVMGTNQGFAPGQLAINSESPANSFAAGHQVPPGPFERAGDGASDFGPEIVMEIPIGPGP